MGAFTPFKRHANRFNYTPRYYDPAKEAREQRRAELHGVRSDDEPGEYRPGQFIKSSAAARMARRSADSNRGASSKMRIYISIAVVAAVALFGVMLYNKILEVVGLTEGSSIERVMDDEDVFDPYAPITIVPNDYEE